ncbi:DUF4294 domain-containing protein [Petrimonas sp.]|uniref:DUF4294 domain-containing protein n=1 Tax=Petrimonas sp. TaxID=2023866 RepID=UPI003F51068A
MKRIVQLYLFLAAAFVYNANAQDLIADNTTPAKQKTTIYLLPNVYPAVVIDGDTVACMSLHDFIKYSPLRFASNREQVQYTKLIRDVRKTLPYAKEIAVIITETYEYMETLPDDKARQRHLNQMEKYLYDAYKPKMSKLTRSQGQLLMKLVDRETNSSSYHIVDAFMGTGKAVTYNFFASLFGNSLKKRYNPYAEDRLTERACVLVEQGVF